MTFLIIEQMLSFCKFFQKTKALTGFSVSACCLQNLGQEVLQSGMLGIVEDLGGAALLDELALVH